MKGPRIRTVLFLVIAVGLMAAPTAANHTVVVSSHTTTSDFDGATTLQNVSTVDNAVVYAPGEGSTATRAADTGTVAQDTGKYGLRVQPNVDLQGLNLTVSSNTNGATTAYIYEEQSGSLIGSTSISGGVANISTDLQAGENYRVVLDAGGSQRTPGTGGNQNYPYTSEDVDITGGYDGASFSSFSAWAIRSVSAWTIGDGKGIYVSANHSGSRIIEGYTNLTFTDANATVTWEGSNGGGWNQVAQQTYSTDGNKTLSLSSGSYDTWRVNVTFENTSAGGTATLEDEGIKATTSAPTVDNNTASPQSTKINSETVTLSIDVSDGDFGTAQGDSVDVEFIVNGTVEGTDTLTANGTAELEYSPDFLGGVEWYARATDSYGHTQESQTFTFSTPNTLSIYNETAPHQRISGVNVNATITGTGRTVDLRQTSDGNYSLSGLPANESYVFTITANNYSTREIYIRNIYEQSSIYLLHDSVTSVRNSITITDRTGRFSNNPAILVDRVINTSNVSGTPDNGPEWVTVGGDFLGAGGFYVIDLEESARYRFRVINQRGDTRVLGGYTAKSPGEINLEIGSVTYDLSGENNTYEWDAELSNQSAGAWIATFSYYDYENETSNLTVTLKTREDGTVLNQTTFTTGPYGEVVYTVPISNSTVENETVVVEWSASRNGTVITGQRYLGASRLLDFPLSEVWQTVAYAAAMLVIAFLVGAGAGVPPALVTLGIMSTFGVFVGLAPPELGFGATGLVLLLGAIYMIELPD